MTTRSINLADPGGTYHWDDLGYIPHDWPGAKDPRDPQVVNFVMTFPQGLPLDPAGRPAGVDAAARHDPIVNRTIDAYRESLPNYSNIHGVAVLGGPFLGVQTFATPNVSNAIGYGIRTRRSVQDPDIGGGERISVFWLSVSFDAGRKRSRIQAENKPDLPPIETADFGDTRAELRDGALVLRRGNKETVWQPDDDAYKNRMTGTMPYKVWWVAPIERMWVDSDTGVILVAQRAVVWVGTDPYFDGINTRRRTSMFVGTASRNDDHADHVVWIVYAIGRKQQDALFARGDGAVYEVEGEVQETYTHPGGWALAEDVEQLFRASREQAQSIANLSERLGKIERNSAYLPTPKQAATMPTIRPK
jgi:hypothetical protein